MLRPENVVTADCPDCNCKEFVQHPWNVDRCVNCFHDHNKRSSRDLNAAANKALQSSKPINSGKRSLKRKTLYGSEARRVAGRTTQKLENIFAPQNESPTSQNNEIKNVVGTTTTAPTTTTPTSTTSTANKQPQQPTNNNNKNANNNNNTNLKQSPNNNVPAKFASSEYDMLPPTNSILGFKQPVAVKGVAPTNTNTNKTNTPVVPVISPKSQYVDLSLSEQHRHGRSNSTGSYFGDGEDPVEEKNNNNNDFLKQVNAKMGGEARYAPMPLSNRAAAPPNLQQQPKQPQPTKNAKGVAFDYHELPDSEMLRNTKQMSDPDLSSSPPKSSSSSNKDKEKERFDNDKSPYDFMPSPVPPASGNSKRNQAAATPQLTPESQYDEIPSEFTNAKQKGSSIPPPPPPEDDYFPQPIAPERSVKAPTLSEKTTPTSPNRAIRAATALTRSPPTGIEHSQTTRNIRAGTAAQQKRDKDNKPTRKRSKTDIGKPMFIDDTEVEKKGRGIAHTMRAPTATRSQREKILGEILETERTYVLNLETLIRVFMVPLRRENRILSSKTVDEIFGNIEQIVTINRSLMERLEEKLSKYDDDLSTVGEIFIEMGSSFRPYYTTYWEGYLNAIQVLNECEKNSAFSVWISNASLAPELKYLSFRSLLALPLQHIPTYHVLLADLFENTTKKHKDKENLRIAVVTMRQVADGIENAIKEGENRQKIQNIQNSFLSTGGFEFLITGRRYVRDGVLTKVCRKANKERWFFLFNDVLVYATVSVTGAKLLFNKFVFHGSFDMTKVDILDSPDTLLTRNAFQFISTKKSFKLIAESAEEKGEWMNDLLEVKNEALARRGKSSVGRNPGSPVPGKTESSPPAPENVYSALSSVKNPEEETFAPIFAEDNSSKGCLLCGQQFTLLRRRHHCRICGNLICHSCSKNKVKLPGRQTKERACDVCFAKTVLTTPETIQRASIMTSSVSPTLSGQLGHVQTGGQRRSLSPSGSPTSSPKVAKSKKEKDGSKGSVPTKPVAVAQTEHKHHGGKTESPPPQVQTVQHFVLAEGVLDHQFELVDGEQDEDEIPMAKSIPYADLTLDKEIGRGGFGVVYKGTLQGKVVAIKKSRDDVMDDTVFQREVDLIQKLPYHPNLVRLEGISVDPNNPKKQLIVVEFVEGGSLQDFMDEDVKLTIDDKMKIITGTARGMNHLAQHHITHRDLAARNILLGKGNTAKITDFGLSREVKDTTPATGPGSNINSVGGFGVTTTAWGPLKIMSPESITEKVYSERTDVWSFGIFLVELLSESQPYGKLTPMKVAMHNSKKSPLGSILKLDPSWPLLLKQVIEACLEFDPKQRPTFSQLVDILEEDAANRN